MKEIQDHYFHLAKKQGYVARSAFKLQEIDEKFKLFGPHTRTVIDIGCAPGSRLQYTSKILAKNKGKQEPLLIGFDLKKVDISLPFTHTFIQDITDQEAVKQIINEQLGISNIIAPLTGGESDRRTQDKTIHNQSQENPPFTIHHTPLVDVIISDMAPDTIGSTNIDGLRSIDLIMQTMWMYETLLKENGKFAIKVFMGTGFDNFIQYCRNKRGTSHIKIFKPKACRKESKETYIVKI